MSCRGEFGSGRCKGWRFGSSGDGRSDAARVRAAVDQVEGVARTDSNLMPAVLVAVKAYATVGEISDRLRRVFGEFQESVVI